ncbi:MAG: YjbF family lipoprotein [Paraglaciecola sp.]|nr:YjbF family lipoprotein [Paraglaciecola sp.]
MMRHITISIAIITCLLILISSCSSTHQAYLRSLNLAFSEPHSFILSDEQIRQSPADLIYVTKDEQGTVVLALAFIDKARYKWVSSDNVSLIEEHGRITKTFNLPNNLDFVVSTKHDPLSDPNQITDTTTWQRNIDFDSRFFDVELFSTFKVLGQQTLKVQDLDIDTVMIEEDVRLVDIKSYKTAEAQWTNQFWFNKESGRLLRSRQKTVPGGSFFDIVYVSRALRL